MSLERFDRDRVVSVHVIADGPKIMLSNIYGQVGPPVVLDPFIGDGAARVNIGNPVGAAA